ncbi:AraC family transcriptional regulator [Maricurvus nonylphenolicus]|uniref:AraC family transcriptional regulator n=1 Tax=Maricurvus nonylphenolicus TaxID=1008307 RepID=UPI0036F230D4
MAAKHQLTVYWARLIFDLLQREKLDAVTLFKDNGLDVSLLTQTDAYFDADCFASLWQDAVKLTGNPALGLKMNMASTLESFGNLSIRFASSSNLREALVQARAYYKLIGTALELHIDETAAGCKIIIRGKGNRLPPPREGYDATLSLIAQSLKTISSPAIIPKHIAFGYPQPDYTAPYLACFDCPLTFASDDSYLLLSEDALEQPLIFANPELAKKHEQALAHAIKAIKDAPLADQVSYIIEALLPKGEPNIQHVADALHLSPRTLQRKLSADNQNFRALLDDTRKTLAAKYIADHTVNLQVIHYELGFKDHSNFYRAFRRWYGCSPGVYRDKINNT